MTPLFAVSLALNFLAAPEPVVLATDVPVGFPRASQVRAITEEPKHHFFGYYGIFPWSASGRYMVYLETTFSDRLVEEVDRAGIVLHDVQSGERKTIAETGAWNFQQGALAHWIGNTDRIVYNDRVDGVVVSVVLDVGTGRKRTLPRPIAAVSPDGRTAASINYARLRVTRPDYGYAGEGNAYAGEVAPADDGLWIFDLETGESKMVVSLKQVFDFATPERQSSEDLFWFNHILFSRDGERIFFLGRTRHQLGPLKTAAFTVGLDGGELRCLFPYAWGASHFDWIDGKRIMATTRYQGESPWRHVLVTDGSADYTVIAPDLLSADGHGHFSPDGRWMVTDSYPDKERYQHLYLVRMEDNTGVEIAKFQEPVEYKGFWRCDLHPRWSRDGKRLCIDSTHSGTRQVYVVELDWPTSP
ncbi:MAG: hypothetical protein AMXMBFR84_21160 [Candidatus Hydrogenedentota bacterium]